MTSSDKEQIKRKRQQEEKRIRVVAAKCSLEVFGTITFADAEHSPVRVNKMMQRLFTDIAGESPDFKSVHVISVTKKHGLHVHYLSNKFIKGHIRKLTEEKFEDYGRLGSINERSASDSRHVTVRYMEKNLSSYGSVKYRGKLVSCDAVELSFKYPRGKFNSVVDTHGIDKAAVTQWVREPESFKNFEDYVLFRIQNVAEGIDDLDIPIDQLNFVMILPTTYIPFMKKGSKVFYRFRNSCADKRTRHILMRKPKFEMKFHEILDSFLQNRGYHAKQRAYPEGSRRA